MSVERRVCAGCSALGVKVQGVELQVSSALQGVQGVRGDGASDFRFDR